MSAPSATKSAGSSTTRSAFTRDQRGVLGLVGGGLVVLGLMEGSAGALWPDVIDAFDVSKGAFGVASGVGLSLALPVLVFGGRLTSWFDKRVLLSVAAALLVLASLGFTIGYGLAVLAALLAVRAAGIALIDLASNALAMEVEQQTGRHLMSPLHSGFSAGIVVGAGLAWMILAIDGGYRAVYSVLAVLLAGFIAVGLRERIARPFPRPIPTATGSAVATALYQRADIRLLTAVIAVAFCGELLLAQWIGIYLRDELGFSATIGVRAVLLLGGAMLVGRLINTKLTARLGPRRSLLIQGMTLTIGGVLLVATETAWLTVLGCGVVGLGIAGIAPTALSLAGVAVPSSPGAASGAALMGGYLGVALIPFAAGGIASVASVRVVLLVETVFGLFVIAAAINLDRWMRTESAGD